MNAELPGPAGFAAATQFVTESDVAANIPCGPEVEPIVEAAKAFRTAGFTLALVQIGGEHQDGFRFRSPKSAPGAARSRLMNNVGSAHVPATGDVRAALRGVGSSQPVSIVS